MTDWKAIILGSLVTAGLTLALGLAIFPLFFVGPLLGGFVTVYLVTQKEKEGALNGALAGLIGGLIIGILSLLGLGIITAFITLLSASLGNLAGFISALLGGLLTLVLILITTVLGAIGGVLAEANINN